MRIIKPHTICRIFGHSKTTIEEVFGIKLSNNRYCIMQQQRCSRCNEILERKVLEESISRAEMLKQGWFITNE